MAEYLAGANTTSPTFGAYTGKYIFYPDIPSNATITNVTFNFETNAIKVNSLSTGSTKKLGGFYGFFYGETSSATPQTTSTSIGEYVNPNNQTNGCELITSEAQLEYSSTSSYIPSTKSWTVSSSSNYDIFKSSVVYIYFCRTGITYNGNFAYQTVNNYKGALKCTITYSTPSVTDPTNLTITQNLNGTYTLDWDASTGTGGSGSVTYSIKDTDGVTIATNWTSTSYTSTIPGYTYTYTWRVTAHYSGTTSNAVRIDAKFNLPSINKPSWISINPSSGNSVTVNWGPATLENTTGSIRYSLYYRLNNGSYISIKSLADTTITFNEDDLSNWGEDGDTFIFQVDAYASNLSNNDNGYSLGPAASSDSSSFTFITGNVVAYCDGSTWKECKVWYCANNGNAYTWVECIPYYCDGTTWQEINAKI